MDKTFIVTAAAACGVFFASPVPAQLDAMLDAVKVSSASSGFAADLEYARSEAIRRASRIVVCKSADGETCARTGEWGQGWIIFQDADGDSIRGRGEPLLARSPRLSRALRLVGSLNAVRSVEFGPTGAARLIGASLDVGTLTVCRDGAGAEARQVTLRAGKAPQLRRATVAGCV